MGERPICRGGPYDGCRPDWRGTHAIGPSITPRPGQNLGALWTYELEFVGNRPIWRYRQLPGVRVCTMRIEAGGGGLSRRVLPAGSYPVLSFSSDTMPGDRRERVRARIDHQGVPWLLTLGHDVWIDPESVDG